MIAERTHIIHSLHVIHDYDIIHFHSGFTADLIKLPQILNLLETMGC